jgi:hypothetical protein
MLHRSVAPAGRRANSQCAQPFPTFSLRRNAVTLTQICRALEAGGSILPEAPWML